MASIRRTLSPFDDRSYQNGPNNFQSSSQKLLSCTRTTLSPVRRFLAGLLLQKHYSKRSNYFSWKKWLSRCLAFFLLGFLLGMAPLNSDFVELKQHDLTHTDLSFELKQQLENVGKNESDLGITVRQDNDVRVAVEDVELGIVNRKSEPIVHLKQLIVVTPTFNRALQAYYLNRLAQVLKLVKPPVLWIVVEMNVASMETAEMLRKMGIMYQHLVCTRNSTDVKDRGVHQRNTALEFIERHRLDGIVYFADDDNIYSLDLFESIRVIRMGSVFCGRFGTWPVGMMAQSKNKSIQEGPVCNGRQVVGWHTNEKSKRLCRFHVDMSGFAFNSTIVWDPKRWQRPTSDLIRQLDTVKEGFQETSFIEQIIEDESQMEGIPLSCGRIMNWHLHLDSSEYVYPEGWMLQKNLDVVFPFKG